MSERQWSGTTFGNGWMHRALIRCLRVIDVRAVYVFTAVFILPFVLIFNRSRGFSFSFYRDALGYGRWKSAVAVYRNHYAFSQAVIDKFAMYAGKRFDVEVEGMENFTKLAARDEGFVIMSSHIGNYEIAGYTLVSESKVINAVVYASEKASVMANRTGMFEKTNIRMITMKPDLAYLYEIDNAISGGDIVSFPTDRSAGNGKMLECNFLGRPARLPQGPFSVATMRSVKVLAVNVMKEKCSRYRIFVTPLDYDSTLPRKEQLKQLSSLYVAELEKRVRQYPLQWFNFYDFWA